MSQQVAEQSMLLELSQIAVSLSANRDLGSLQSEIIKSVMRIFYADGASLYVLSDDAQELQFQVVSNKYLNIQSGGIWAPVQLPPLQMYEDNAQPNMRNVATAALHSLETVNIADAYEETAYDLTGVKRFDEANNYRTMAILTVPMLHPNGDRLGALQIINPRDEDDQLSIFTPERQLVGQAIASQVSVAYSNHQMIAEQQRLWQSLLRLMARSIDEKSPYTSGHCQRVPILAQNIAQALNECDEGRYAHVSMDKQALYELDVAALLHDVGKLSTPEYVVDKATKLETIFNRIHLLRTRYEVLWREARITELEAIAAGMPADQAQQQRIATQEQLSSEFARLAVMNNGQVPLSDQDMALLEDLSERSFAGHFPQNIGVSPSEQKLLNENGYRFISEEPVKVLSKSAEAQLYVESEWNNMTIASGTLNTSERNKINEHAAVGIRMLKELPFPTHLDQVVNIAGAHHEKLDGTGYPNGLKAEDLSLRARILALADVYEALSAADRPYKEPKTATEFLRILALMAKDRHVDAEILEIFLRSGKWQEYNTQYLRPEQCNEVELDKIIAILDPNAVQQS